MGLHRAYEVGGAVRDGLLAELRGEPFAAKDVDIAVVGNTFEELLALCRAEGSAAELVVARQRVALQLTAPWTPRARASSSPSPAPRSPPAPPATSSPSTPIPASR